MRTLTKLAEPPILTQHGPRWTADYVAAATPAARKRKERWAHKQIRHVLRDETNGKCAYCESRIGAISYPHVEHKIPKASHPQLAHDWANLTAACELCNNNKSDYYDPVVPVMDPYNDPVETKLCFWGDYVTWTAGDDQSEITVLKLDLNRQDLVDDRRIRLEAVTAMLHRWQLAATPKKDVLAAAIREDVLGGEFTTSMTAFLRANTFPM